MIYLAKLLNSGYNCYCTLLNNITTGKSTYIGINRYIYHTGFRKTVPI